MNKVRRFAIVFYFCLFTIIFVTYLSSLSASYFVPVRSEEERNKISDGIVYFGRPSCPSCEEFASLLMEEAQNAKQQIFYFDTDYFRQNKLLSEEELQEIFKQYGIDSVPALIKLTNYKVTGACYAQDIMMNEKVDIKNQVRKLIRMNEDEPAYIPHYSVIIGLFIATLLFLHIYLFCDIIVKRAVLVKYLSIVMLSFHAANSIILIHAYRTIVKYLNQFALTGNTGISILLFVTLLLNAAALSVNIIYRLVKNSESKRNLIKTD